MFCLIFFTIGFSSLLDVLGFFGIFVDFAPGAGVEGLGGKSSLEGAVDANKQNKNPLNKTKYFDISSFQ